MGANYVGPGWYWVEDVEQPLFLEMKNGLPTARVYVSAIGICESWLHRGEPFKILAHIPRPAQRPVVDWSVMPAWAKWVAMDDKGRWFWSSVKLSHVFGMWDFDLEDKSTTRIHGDIPSAHAPTYTGDWRNSLVERPE